MEAQIITIARLLEIFRRGWQDQTPEMVERQAERFWPNIGVFVRRLRNTPHCSSCRADLVERLMFEPAKLQPFFKELAPDVPVDLTQITELKDPRAVAVVEPKIARILMAGQVMDVPDDGWGELIKRAHDEDWVFRGISVLPLPDNRMRVMFY